MKERRSWRKNCSMVKSDNMRYENKIVAFVDMLGFRHLVFQSRHAAMNVIEKLDEALRRSLECVGLENGPHWLSVKLFSDCLCFSCNDGDLFYMLSEMALLQLVLSLNGIFVRGALAYGRHFENERMIFSEGLINAYDLNEGNRYPRILIRQTMVDRILSEAVEYYRQPRAPWPGRQALRPYLIMAPDGQYFLDYLQRIAEDDYMIGEMDWQLETHKRAVLEQTEKNKGKHEIVDKYRWVAEYHNFKFCELYDPDSWQKDYFEQLRNKLLIPMDVFPSFKKQGGEFGKVAHRE